ncbi:hypothetical protein XBJ2_1260001 [Xenorhabdus bovienii str. Jollieti]|uniref:Uncharacterized protein n=1 Tax=Xenorhabdus bovienii (strain SS-2004) TaxID=406818 RepID=D3V1D3_XENBS|nr:hypothetical protein [Xenorhabdus bovienii]CBJ81477.1 hypothetical protein XBJ1_2351 [Xenorhabdus bovienii SS-2004]CDH27256.1 hypothetical protein XBJ2_1260001 [Xenorhabdus bovienii str. Jollieti]
MPFTLKPAKEHFGAYVTCQNVSELSFEEYEILKLHLYAINLKMRVLKSGSYQSTEW